MLLVQYDGNNVKDIIMSEGDVNVKDIIMSEGYSDE